MDGTAAIEANRIALTRIVAMLAEMAGLGAEAAPGADKFVDAPDSPHSGLLRKPPLPLKGGEEERPAPPPPLPCTFEEAIEERAASRPALPLPRRSGERWPAKRDGVGVDLTRDGACRDAPHPDARAQGVPRRTLPRLLWRAILALLRPAESATRRLIIATARGLTVPPPRLHKPKPKTMEPLMRRLGIAVMIPPANAARDGLSSPAKRGVRRTGEAGDSPQRTMRNMVEGALPEAGGAGVHPRTPAFPLFDPPRRLALYGQRHNTIPPHAAPRIVVPGITEPHRLPPPPSPDDPISATCLAQRIAALAAALDDLPGQARRFARLKARLDARRARDPKTPCRLSPIRRVPPGGRLIRYDPAASHRRNIREVDEILAHAHSLALYALENPDTS